MPMFQSKMYEHMDMNIYESRFTLHSGESNYSTALNVYTILSKFSSKNVTQRKKVK